MTKSDCAVMRRALLSLACAGVFASAAAQAQTAAPVPVRPAYGQPLSLEDAKALVAAGEAQAKKLGVSMSIVVVEPTGDLVLAEKMNDTQYSSTDIAIAKARTSARFRRPTKELEDGIAGGRMSLLDMPGAIPIEGGVMVLRGGKLVGAVGVSGGSSPQDSQVAAAAAAAIR